MNNPRSNPRSKYRKWTKSDLDYLRLLYPHLSQSQIAIKMQLSRNAVRGVLSRFQIKKT